MPNRRTLRHGLTLLGVAALAACASSTLQPDLAATAPRLEGFGSTRFEPTTTSAKAREHFQSGVLQAYAFNEREAVRQFKAALAADPACAICAWGVAWQLGPIINAPKRGDLREAQRHVDHALKHAAKVTPRERAFIEAMALRYGHESTAKDSAPLMAARCGPGGSSDGDDQRHPLDRAYADRLHALLARFADDADLLSLWAEAEMVATTTDWFDAKTGKPSGRMGEVAERIEKLLVTQAQHTGLNHYLIHTVDAPPVAQRALAAADRLGALAPKSPHLVHMPAHTYAHVGRYADATRVNQQALAVDVELKALQAAQGFSNSKDWTYHNLHFQWFGALMEGRGDLAVDSARRLAQHAARWGDAYGEYVRSLPAITLLRLQRWAALAAEPAPAGNNKTGVADALHGHAVAVARLRQGDVAAAKQGLTAVVAANLSLAKAHGKPKGFDAALRALGEAARAHLAAEIALAEKRPALALQEQQKAVAAAEKVDDNEPPMLAGGALNALAGLQQRAGELAAAEASYRSDLQRWPASGWALRGLAQVVQAQGRTTEAQALRAQLAEAWPLADAALKP